MYSQVHKYWDIDTIPIFLALYTTTMDLKWNKMCFNCRLSALIWGYLHPNQVNCQDRSQEPDSEPGKIQGRSRLFDNRFS